MDLKKQVKATAICWCIQIIYLLQDLCVHITIPPGEHGEVSMHLNRTTAHIRQKPAYKHDTYFDPSALLTSIQAKSVPTCVAS